MIRPTSPCTRRPFTPDRMTAGFDAPYGLPVAPLGDPEELPSAYIALGHGIDNRRLVATANRHARRSEDLQNLLDDTSPGVLRYLRRPEQRWALFTLPGPDCDNDACGCYYTGTWDLDYVDADTDGAVPVTILDIETPRESPARLRHQAEALRQRWDYGPIHPAAGGGYPRRARIVAICGSTRFMADMIEAAWHETIAGRIVVMPHCDLKTEHPLWATDDQKERLKSRLDDLHEQKIRLADEVLVVAPGGYIGESTAREILFATARRVPVRYWPPTETDDAAEQLLSELGTTQL